MAHTDAEHARPRKRRPQATTARPQGNDRRASVAALSSEIRAQGLRVTSARIAVYEVLVDAQGPVTHGDVCDKLEGWTFDRATIYRNLLDLAEAGLARRSDVGDRLWRFERVDHVHATRSADGVHPHFVCTKCGRVECLPDGAVTLSAVRGSPRALKTAQIEVHVRGTCDDCQR